MRTHEYFYVDGRWIHPASHATMAVYSASTEEVIGHVPCGTPEDVDRAAAAARRAFDGGWAETAPAERAEWLRRLATALEARVPEVASTIAQEVGTPISFSTSVQARLPVNVARNTAEHALTLGAEERIDNSTVIHEPYGVVGMITPWNFPLHQIIAKVAPAMAAGCTMVVKPSELAPLNADLLAEAAMEIGLPPGVLNIVQGTGPVVGEAIARHPDIDMVSFTGSVRAGQRVLVLAADTLKKVALELGGKSAFIVLDDAPLDQAIPAGVNNAMLNAGQTCSAWTRMLVPRQRLNDVVDLATAAVARLRPGDPLDTGTKIGPLISEPQRARVEGYIRKGVEEGARLVAGGGRTPGLTRGHYVEPTIFADVRSGMTIAQEEIFGPVLAILPYDSEEEAVAIANDTIYGLGGGVWSADRDRALRVARRMRTGQVDINGGHFNPYAPFGGYKRSGIGREFGKYGILEYLQVKSLQC